VENPFTGEICNGKQQAQALAFALCKSLQGKYITPNLYFDGKSAKTCENISSK
jgi:hypothetical protein